MKIKSSKFPSAVAAVLAAYTVPFACMAQGIVFTEWAIPAPNTVSTSSVQQQWFANLEQFIFTGQPVGTPGTATYVAPVTGPITSIAANEPELAFVVEVSSSAPLLLASEINYGITDPDATFIGSLGYGGSSYGGGGIGWTTGAGGNTYVTDPAVPVNDLLLEGTGFKMTMAPTSSSANDPFNVTTLYSLNGSGYGSSATVSFELADAGSPNPVPEPGACGLLTLGLFGFISRKGEKVIRLTIR